ncbi:hypothetical protein I3843_01G184700 [Carya illinoinensis]|uniref:Protein SIEVE ELEMENT OCCLUSION B-like n=1 Tax=Carya illinoinensis TaxID=32201 RepID=A0A922G0R8_CARIL|nr:hypothetical protein I3842_01G192100 [Carya illinoinensis]KAG7996910.1 hypothetical protein I3843_01G184700 [Carya illinoinensis]
MATKASLQQPKKGNLSLFTRSDNEILKQINATHFQDDEKFDVESLFIIVKNVLKSATQIIDNAVLFCCFFPHVFIFSFSILFTCGPQQGSQAFTVAHLYTQEYFLRGNYKARLFSFSFLKNSTYHSLYVNMVANETTQSILKKLSNYSWDAKAVLTLAAFALDYGELSWLLAQNQSSDQLAKSLGTLRRVSILLKGPNLEKHREALIELNIVIKTTLEVIECIFELKKLSNYSTKDVPALSTGVDHIRLDVFWAIITIVASTTQICCLTSDEDKKQELSQFCEKLKAIVSQLRWQITISEQQIECKLRLEVVEVFKGLISFKDNVQQLFDGSTKNLVNIDGVLKGKNVLLFISGLDISDDDISILEPIHELISQKDRYKIVWIPIVEKWTEDLKKKFERLRAKMPWYVVQYFYPIAGIRFVKEKWHFKGKPSVVVLSPQGKVESDNAIHMIRVWKIKAFPFTTAQEETLSSNRDWIGSIATGVNPNIESWIKEEKYIFFYGGKDEWIQQFTKAATALASDPVIKEKAQISIELMLVGKGSKGDDTHCLIPGRFWTGIESMFISATHRKTTADAVTLEIQKLLSYKNESTGWAVLSKGSSVVFSSRGTTILKTVEEFDKWKELVQGKGFEVSFMGYHNLVLETSQILCCFIDIPKYSGKIPENVKCPDCLRDMEAYISGSSAATTFDGDGDGNSLHD